MGELVITEEPGKAFEKGRIEAGYMGLDARGHARKGDSMGTKEEIVLIVRGEGGTPTAERKCGYQEGPAEKVP